MSRVFSQLLRRFGQSCTIVAGGVSTETRAFVQPARSRVSTSLSVTRLGVADDGQFCCMGDDAALCEEDAVVLFDGKRLGVLLAEAIYIGDQVSHYEALLEQLPEEAGA